MGEKIKNFISRFWSEYFTNIGPMYTKRCRIGTFGGGMFSKKNLFSQYFHEKIWILDI